MYFCNILRRYGPTNSGKTFTIEGDDVNPGILPRVLDEVFTRSKDIEQKTAGTSIFIWATYLEVYNENVYDLLGANSANRIPMKLVHSIAACIFAVLGVATLLGAGKGLGF